MSVFAVSPLRVRHDREMLLGHSFLNPSIKEFPIFGLIFRLSLLERFEIIRPKNIQFDAERKAPHQR